MIGDKINELETKYAALAGVLERIHRVARDRCNGVIVKA
jgi:hypothetical protein